MLVAVCAWHVRYTRDAARVAFVPQSVAQPPFVVRGVAATIVALEAAGERAGLRVGDVLLEVQGRPYAGRADLARPLNVLAAGDELRVRVQRDGVASERVVTLDRVSRSEGLAETFVTVLIGMFTPWLCVALGFAVAFLRPRDPRARVLLLLMLSFAHLGIVSEADPAGWEPRWFAAFAAGYRGAMSLTWPLAIFLLGILFPERFDLDRRWPALKLLLIVPLAVVALVAGVGNAVGVGDRLAAARIMSPLGPVAGALPFLFCGAIGLFFWMIGHKWGTAPNPDARRRLRLLLFGCATSITPLGLLVLYAVLRGTSIGNLPTALVVLAFAPLPLLPLTLGYVIVVHQALDVKVVVRQGVQYAFARNGVALLQGLASFAVLMGAVGLAADPGVNRPRRILFMAAGMAFVLALRGLAERLRGFVDRRFFREAYDAEQLLTHLGEDVRSVLDVDELLGTVTRRLADTLHADTVSVWLLRERQFVLARTTAAAPPQVTLPEFCTVAERLRLTRQPLRLHWGDPAAWVHRNVTEHERGALHALGADLLLPLTSRDRMLGMLALGAKKSEEPWSPSEVRLLQAVAAQASVALENAQLTAAIASEVARRERMNREIEIAREVQEGLFPQEMPHLQRVELAGMCRPALGVGGDYYDFVELPGAQLGLAVGDVSGKGIPAALLMSALRAALRAQTTFGTTDVATIMERLNQLIYESSPSNRYVTFFYGQYDPVSRRLVYVNAGHLPPLVFRAGCAEPLRLEEGGPVIGLLPVAPYTAGTIELRAGDLLVAFSDGVSEAMNLEDEEYGEERLCRAVRGAPSTAPAPVVRHVLEHVDAFVGAAKQHDDITLIALRAS